MHKIYFAAALCSSGLSGVFFFFYKLIIYRSTLLYVSTYDAKRQEMKG